MTRVVDLVFRDATVVDGTGSPGVITDVAVTADRIDEVGKGLEVAEVVEVVDGAGLVLTPGFIDVHTHDDWAVLLDPDLGCKTLQGVTSVVTGNCGSSPYPEAEGFLPGRGSYPGLSEYFAQLDDSPPAVNVASLVGHGAIRTAVMGLRTARDSTAGERAAMVELVEQALGDGAIGLSSGLAYEPGRYAPPDELVDLTAPVADVGGIYATHMRDEAAGLLDSIDESILVAETAGLPLQISHLKAAGRENWGTVLEALRRIDQARGRGVDVMADQYPYTRGSTLLEQVVTAGALDGPSPFGALSPADVLVAAAPDRPEWIGRTVDEIAAKSGVDGRDMADRMVADAGRTCFVVIDIMGEDDVQAVMAHPAVIIGSDGVPIGDKPHPRLHHTFPRVLGRYTRELGIFDLPTAVHRMTGLAAGRFGFDDRGVIRAGAHADLVLLDPHSVSDTGTYQDPTTVPTGILGVWVNGDRVVDADGVTGRRPGRALRR